MTDNDPTETTENGQRKQLHSENETRSFSLMGSNKDQGEVGTEDRQKRKRGRSATKHKRAKKSYKNKHSKRMRRYRSTLLSSPIEKSFPFTKRHKSQRKKRKHCKHSSSLS